MQSDVRKSEEEDEEWTITSNVKIGLIKQLLGMGSKLLLDQQFKIGF